MREDEEPKIICEKVYNIDDRTKTPEHNKKTVSNKGLYIRINSFEDKDTINRCKTVMSIFEGVTDVYFYSISESKLMKLKGFGVQMNDPMIKELKRIVGEDNIGIK